MKANKVLDIVKSRIIYIFLLVMILFFSAASSNFLTVRNLMNVVKQVAICAKCSRHMHE